MVPQKLSTKVTQVLPRIDLEVAKGARRYLTHDALQIACEVLHAAVELGGLRLKGQTPEILFTDVLRPGFEPLSSADVLGFRSSRRWPDGKVPGGRDR